MAIGGIDSMWTFRTAEDSIAWYILSTTSLYRTAIALAPFARIYTEEESRTSMQSVNQCD
jgi:hypothetical protein